MPDTLFPGQTAVLAASVRDPAYDGVLSGKEVVEFWVTSRYTGPSGQYMECQRARFVPEYRSGGESRALRSGVMRSTRR